MSVFTDRLTATPRLAAVPPRAAAPSTLDAPMGRLYHQAQHSKFVFASPLGPFHHAGRRHALPRFVYFGPHTSDASLRLAVYAGEDHRDDRGSLALLHFIERLIIAPDLGAGLNISLFPQVDVLGSVGASGDRRLARANWSYPDHPEIDLLAKDARVRGYHGFIRVQTGGDDDAITVQLNAAPDVAAASTGVEFLNSDDFAPWPVLWEASPFVLSGAPYGPLSLADDLPVSPFEIVVGIPAAWNLELHREAVTRVLRNVIIRLRGFDAHAQHL